MVEDFDFETKEKLELEIIRFCFIMILPYVFPTHSSSNSGIILCYKHSKHF